MSNRIYLDHNATTQVDDRVIATMIQELGEIGNPSSVHRQGQMAKRRLEMARETVAKFLGVKSQEITFTSSGTESAFLLIHGLLKKMPIGHLVSSGVEHSCVYKTLKEFDYAGWETSLLSPGSFGAITPEQLKDSLRPETRLIVLMAVNNETGVKTDIAAIAEVAYQANIPLVVDAVALLGKESFSIPQGVTAMFFSGHKIAAAKGVGCHFCRLRAKIKPIILGGPQENNRRAGTENLPAILGFSKAIEILAKDQEAISSHLLSLQKRFESGVSKLIPSMIINGEGPRTTNVSNLSFPGIDGESLLMNLDLEGISASHGSACSSGALEPSRVLLNMGFSRERARSSLRFSFGRNLSLDQIDQAVDVIGKVVSHMNKSKY